uniref:Uncharacterized protein n=2 Tax=environmental samples TaxID=68359 RepID=A0A075GXC6_9EURY|nr:hypothetical protein [uncultured marine group II/III euryarchaeote KM3_07_G11]AIF06443.1 hypothetical protein [uncultured marine group II/III euryarchaeote KM3_192_C12]
MEPPAVTARRLLLGLGFALLLATAFALIDGRLPPADCPDDPLSNCTSTGTIGWLIPGAAIASLLAGFTLSNSNSPLSTLFPSQDVAVQEAALTEEVAEELDEEDLSDAWANLEKGLLESKVSEEE